MFPLSAPRCLTGHKNNATIEFFFKREKEERGHPLGRGSSSK
jgi:hypothetical protein